MSGYQHCACRDCFELAVGDVAAMCLECEEAGCEPHDGECQREGAYGQEGNAYPPNVSRAHRLYGDRLFGATDSEE